MNTGVHAAHCCIIHGCKYNNDDCPVTNGRVEQKYPCEGCIEDMCDGCGETSQDCDLPDYNVKPPEIEWVCPPPPPKRIIKEDISKDFLKGMLYALLIIILLHIGIAYALLN